MLEKSLTVKEAVLWVIIYFGILLFCTFLDVAVWRKLFQKYSRQLNLITMLICIAAFIAVLYSRGYKLHILANITLTGFLMAVGCAVLLFLLTDKCVDPFLENIFPKSQQEYQKTVEGLKKSPVLNMFQICFIAPFIEEVLMRGLVLGGLKNTSGTLAALVISAILFALLHFNMVQTLSAFVCGMALGLLYIKTDSVFCCILAHGIYNLISYITIIQQK